MALTQTGYLTFKTSKRATDGRIRFFLADRRKGDRKDAIQNNAQGFRNAEIIFSVKRLRSQGSDFQKVLLFRKSNLNVLTKMPSALWLRMK